MAGKLKYRTVIMIIGEKLIVIARTTVLNYSVKEVELNL